MKERFLITGATGFIGQALARTLGIHGFSVRALLRPGRDPESVTVRALAASGVELACGGFDDPSALRAALHDVQGVVHLAGQLLKPGISLQAYERLHVEGTRQLLAACAETPNLRAILHVSTTGVLGVTGDHPAAESALCNPGNIYERTKAEGERLALEMGSHYKLPVIVARPALVYGPGDLHLLGWFRAIQSGYYCVVGSGLSQLHPIYIRHYWK